MNLDGKTQVRAEEAVGKTVESVAWSAFDSDPNLTVVFTDGTYLYLVGGEDRGGTYLDDDVVPVPNPANRSGDSVEGEAQVVKDGEWVKGAPMEPGNYWFVLRGRWTSIFCTERGPPRLEVGYWGGPSHPHVALPGDDECKDEAEDVILHKDIVPPDMPAGVTNPPEGAAR